jgi:type I restriction enzyme S subunit
MCSDGIRLKVDPRRFSASFIHAYLNSSCFRRRAVEASTGSTRQRIGLADLKKLPLLVPNAEEQTAIATILLDMDAEIEALEARREKTRLVKQGMMQELLTGRTRLVPEGA